MMMRFVVEISKGLMIADLDSSESLVVSSW